MAKIDLPGLHRVKSKGRTYYYYGRGRGSIKLSGEPGSAEFLVAYEAARKPELRIDKRKVKAWVHMYRAGPFQKTASQTQRVWSPWLIRIEEEFGEFPLAAFDRPAARQVINKWRSKWRDKPRAADLAKQVLSAVLSFAMMEGALMANVCIGMANFYKSDRSDLIWTEDDLQAFLKAAPAHIGRVAQLAILTGLRTDDVLRLSWSHIQKDEIRIFTAKSRFKVEARIPLYDELRDFLSSIPKVSTALLTTLRGTPWQGFGTDWNEALHDAGLHGRLRKHDLRGTAATKFYLLGFGVEEIAEIMAWEAKSVDRILKRYVPRHALTAERIKRINEGRKGRTGT